MRMMLMDVFIWLLLLAWVIISFGSFLRALHAEPFGQPGQNGIELPDGCLNADVEFESMGFVVSTLFETTLTGDGHFGCMNAASTATWALPVMYCFILFSNIILTNMLIAMVST